MAHDVFISYPGKDKTVADAVCAKLEDQKIRCWIAPRDIPAGKNFAESIIDAIDSSKVFVLIWSMNTNSSEHILNEVNQAFNQGIPIIPFRIQEVEPTSAMRYYFGRTHWLDAITPPLERHIDNLAGSILAILDRTPEVIPEPVVVEVEPVHEKPPAQEPELRPPPVKDQWHDSKEKRKVRSALKNETKSAHILSNKKRILIPIGAGVLVVAAIVLLLLNGVFEGLPFTEKTGTVPPTNVHVSSTSTQTSVPATSTPTAMPAWMEEVNVWANPILAAIESQPPDFIDDFSRLDADWIVNSNEMYCPGFDLAGSFKVVNGELQLALGPSCQHFSFTHPMLNTQNSNFILQTDIKFPQTSTSYEIGVNNGNRSVVDFILNYTGWVLFTQAPGTEGEMLLVQDAPFPEELTTSVTFTILKNGATYLFYMDDTLLLSYSSQGDDTGTQVIDLLVSSGGQDIDSNPITMDNIQFWDLDNLFIPERILAQIENIPPDFADDFSSVDPDWDVFSDDRQCPAFDPAGKFMVVNGELQLEVSPSCPFFAFTHPGIIEGQIGNYVLQTDINFVESAISYEFIASTEQGIMVDFIISQENWALTVPDPEIQEGMQTIHEGGFPFDSSKPFTFTVIKNEETFLFYLDEMLLLSYGLPTNDEGIQRIDLAVSHWTDQPFAVEYITLDNVRYWDLDNLFIPERILAQIENESPAFADDFSSVDPAWQVLENPSATYNPENANLEITEGLMRLHFENTRGGILSHPDMQYSKYVLQVDVDFQNNPVGMEFRMYGPLDEQPNFGLGSDGHWNFEAGSGGVVLDRIEGDIPIGKRPDFSKPVTITLINISPHFLVYLNSALLFSYSKQNGKGPFLLDFVIDSGKTVTERRIVELDNFKIWNLAGQE